MELNDRTAIVEQCQGCERVHMCGHHCTAYLHPDKKWDRGKKCPLASHLTKVSTVKEKARVGQKKSRKRSK